MSTHLPKFHPKPVGRIITLISRTICSRAIYSRALIIPALLAGVWAAGLFGHGSAQNDTARAEQITPPLPIRHPRYNSQAPKLKGSIKIAERAAKVGPAAIAARPDHSAIAGATTLIAKNTTQTTKQTAPARPAATTKKAPAPAPAQTQTPPPTPATSAPAPAPAETSQPTAQTPTAQPGPGAGAGAKVSAAKIALPPLPSRKPKPKPPTTPEGIFLAAMDKLIAPARATRVTPGDAKSVVIALKAYKRSNLKAAKAAHDQIKHRAARKLVEWYALRAGFGRPAAYYKFLTQNPAWPARKTLIKRAEEQLFVTGGTAGEIKAYFKSLPAQTGAGYAALASAYLAEKNEPRAKEFAAKAWHELSLATTLETGFIKRFGHLLTIADHRWRIDRLLINNSRWRGTRRARAAKVRRLIPLLPSKQEQDKTKARLAIYLRTKSAAKLLAALSSQPQPSPTSPAAPTAPDAQPSSAQPSPAPPAALPVQTPPDWGLQYQRMQLLRRQKKHDEAWKILLNAPDDKAKLVNPDDWWRAKQAAVYDALKAGRTKIAVALAAKPGPISVNPRKDAAFIAGWITMRHLKDYKKAAAHFKVMRDAADGPLSASKAAFWLARARQHFDPAGARKSLQDAASFNHTFHGQLARQTLSPNAQDLPILPPKLPSAAQARRFTGSDAIQAILVAQQAGVRHSIIRAFFNHLRYYYRDQADVLMLAHLARASGDTQMSVRIGKTGIARKLNLYYYSYPTHALPLYNPLRPPPEPAFLLGIARQETEFNTKLKSGAGARGILQIMPITARHVCADYKIKCSISRLVSEPAYNTMIGSAYIGDRLRDFKGSYVLTLSGYNAGPGRTRQWIKRFGDPRAKDIDVVDWIERIPFTETRKYVTKVLSNIQIYRARLGDQSKALQILADLNRAKTGTP